MTAQRLTISATPRIGIEQVTPTKAREWLELSIGNRRVRPQKVAQYARDMREEKWVVGDQAISFDTDGNLINGHHRLNAVIHSGSVVLFLVIRGLQKDATKTIDTGLGRTFGDTLQGVANATHVAAVARLWWGYNGGDIRFSYTPSHRELADVLDANPSIVDVVRRARSFNLHRVMAVSPIAFVCAATCVQNPFKSEDFLQGVATGAALAKTDARLHLRERLINNRTSKARLLPLEILALTIKAWNAFSADAAVGALRWGNRSARPEAFPLIQS